MRLDELHPGIRDFFDSDRSHWHYKPSDSRPWVSSTKTQGGPLIDILGGTGAPQVCKLSEEVEKLGETDIMILCRVDRTRTTDYRDAERAGWDSAQNDFPGYVIAFIKNKAGDEIVDIVCFEDCPHNMEIVNKHLLKDHVRGSYYQFVTGRWGGRDVKVDSLHDEEVPLTYNERWNLKVKLDKTAEYAALPDDRRLFSTDPVSLPACGFDREWAAASDEDLCKAFEEAGRVYCGRKQGGPCWDNWEKAVMYVRTLYGNFGQTQVKAALDHCYGQGCRFKDDAFEKIYILTAQTSCPRKGR